MYKAYEEQSQLLGDYQAYYEDVNPLVTFMDEAVVIVGKDKKTYHKHGCEKLDMTEYLVFNVENAEYLKYKPCKTCIKDEE